MLDIPQQNPLKYGFSGIEQLLLSTIDGHHIRSDVQLFSYNLKLVRAVLENSHVYGLMICSVIQLATIEKRDNVQNYVQVTALSCSYIYTLAISK